VSRFDTTRRGRILAWTGAALAWATVAIAGLDNQGALAQNATGGPTGPLLVPASEMVAMPSPPAGGLVILRYRPSAEETTEVRTVYVRQSAPSSAAQVTASAPAPRTSGS
jgi:hypothetical protein